MRWDYYTFEKQPPKFIEEILIFMNQESQKARSETKQTAISSKGFSRG